MLAVLVSGLVTGWAIAVPIGAVGAFLVSLAARSPWRTAAAAGLGVASVDGVYAALAVTVGAALAGFLAPVAGPLRVASGVVLLVVAGLTAVHALTRAGRADAATPLSPGRAYALFVGLTAVNPTTVVYFVAVVVGDPHLAAGPARAVVFVAAAFAASASWQLTLALGGAGLGRVLAGPAAHRATGLVSAVVVAALALRTMLG